jgi:signal transduction histidine kinase/ActR/RegA family two-component response regulator
MTDLLREEAGVTIWNFDAATRLYSLDSDRLQAGDVGVQGRRKLSPEEMTAEIHPDDRDGITLAFMQTMTTGAPLVVEYRHFRAEDGGWARLRAAWRGSHQAANGLWNIVGITHDVSPLAEARDAALAAAEVKAQFLANMSHEIRTPMNGVLGVLHLLKRERLSEDGRRLLEEALGCGAMLSELLNDVIDFSRIEAGKVELTPQPLDPVALLDSVASLLRPQAEAKGLYVRTTVLLGSGWVNVDPVRLRPILFNLLGNAVKFTVEGGVSATLSLSGEGQTQRLRIEICDTGIGIDADTQTALFERFQQADGTTTRRFGGSGLGLAIARGLAQQMGGDIGLVSTPGQGSTFWVEIASPAAQPPAQLSAPMEPGEDLLAGLSVLVVEDNATNRLIATRLLEQLGAWVATAPDGAEGLAAAAVEAFDLIFMDIQMPVMDGLKATAGIRRMSGPNATAPILAMTANAMTHQIDSYLAAGMNGWVSKPLSPTRLVEAILRVLTEAENQAVA